MAAGLLIVGLSVIGAQVQHADQSVRTLERRTRAVMLAESQLALLGLGVIKLDSLDPILDGDFGPRFPDFGWTMMTEPTSVDRWYSVQLDVWHRFRDQTYEPNSFEFDGAELLYSVHSLEMIPLPLDLGLDFGLPEQQFLDLSDRLNGLGIPGLDASKFDLSTIAQLTPEELLRLFGILSELPGFDVSYLTPILPPDLLDILREAGALGDQAEVGPENDEQDETGGSSSSN